MVVPGSIVKVKFSSTFTGPVSVYGLPALVHVASDVSIPMMDVEACTSSNWKSHAENAPMSKTKNDNIAKSFFDAVPNIILAALQKLTRHALLILPEEQNDPR